MAQSLQISMLLSGSASSARSDKATSDDTAEGAENSFAATFGDLLSDNTATTQGGKTRQIPATVSNLSGISIALLAKSDAEQQIDSAGQAALSDDALAQMLAGDKTDSEAAVLKDGALSDDDTMLAASLLRQINLLTPVKPTPADKTQPIITDPDRPTVDTELSELTEIIPLQTAEQDDVDKALTNKNTEVSDENVSVNGRLAGKGSKLTGLTEQTKDKAVHQLTPEPQSQKLHGDIDATLSASGDVGNNAATLISDKAANIEQTELVTSQQHENSANASEQADKSNQALNATSKDSTSLLTEIAQQSDVELSETALQKAPSETTTVSEVNTAGAVVNNAGVVVNISGAAVNAAGAVVNTTGEVVDTAGADVNADGKVQTVSDDQQQSAAVMADAETNVALAGTATDSALTSRSLSGKSDDLASGNLAQTIVSGTASRKENLPQGQTPNGNSQGQQQASAQLANGQYGADLDNLPQQTADGAEQWAAKFTPIGNNPVRPEQVINQGLTATQTMTDANVRSNAILTSNTPLLSQAEQLKQSLNLLHQDAAGQLRERVSLMVRQNIQVAEIRLDPAGLGQMQIKIDMQQDQATVQFIVQQHQAKEMLEQQLPRLREMLQQQGIQLADGQVQQQSQQQDRQLAQRDGGSGNGSARGNSANGEVEEQAVATQVTASVAERLVDYYA